MLKFDTTVLPLPVVDGDVTGAPVTVSVKSNEFTLRLYDVPLYTTIPLVESAGKSEFVLLLKATVNEQVPEPFEGVQVGIAVLNAARKLLLDSRFASIVNVGDARWIAELEFCVWVSVPKNEVKEPELKVITSAETRLDVKSSKVGIKSNRMLLRSLALAV